jgi:hypothetical protein
MPRTITSHCSVCSSAAAFTRQPTFSIFCKIPCPTCDRLEFTPTRTANRPTYLRSHSCSVLSSCRGFEGGRSSNCSVPSHQFAKYLNFGGEGRLKTNSPADQEKAIVYNELVANAVALQTVADQTEALHQLRRQGIEIPMEDLTYFSAYPTSKVKRFGEYPARIRTAEQKLTGERAGARDARNLNRHVLPDKTVKVLFFGESPLGAAMPWKRFENPAGPT